MTTCLEPPPTRTSLVRLPQEVAPATGGEYLVFHLGEHEYGVNIMCVQEIRPCVPPTRIANAPDFIKGVINLRGLIVPIVDLRLKFRLDRADYGRTTVTIMLNIGRHVIGVVVDAMSDVVKLQGDQIQAPPRFNAAVDMAHITGLCTLRSGQRERMLILLDIERLMTSADMGLIAPTSAL